MVDALAIGGDEGRDKLRKAVSNLKEFLNGNVVNNVAI